MGYRLTAHRKDDNAHLGSKYCLPGINNRFSGEKILIDVNKLAEGHDFYQIGGMSVSPDNNLLASASSDNQYKPDGNQTTFRLWDLNKPGAEPVVLGTLNGKNYAIAFSPDGSTLASKSSGSDGTVNLWLTSDSLIEAACQKVRRNLSQAEWDQYFPDEEYRQTCDR